MLHHFPHSAAMQSTLRAGEYKLIRNFKPSPQPLELYRLYQDGDQRGDIEEMKNLAEAMPEKARQMDQQLQEQLQEMQAAFPYLPPPCTESLPHKENVCLAMDHGQKGAQVWMNISFLSVTPEWEV